MNRNPVSQHANYTPSSYISLVMSALEGRGQEKESGDGIPDQGFNRIQDTPTITIH